MKTKVFSMILSGFTFIKNGVDLDYPFIESITSILPIVDEMVVAVGDCTDSTREMIVALDSPKIKIIDTIWDDNLRVDGAILSQQSNIAKNHISGDWGFYIQGDEVIHEKYLEIIRQSIEKYNKDKEVDGLLFKYKHFYGSYDYFGTSRKWYRKEIRVIRNDPAISSYKDAQGFRKNGEKLRVKEIDAWVFHYGWVRDPEAQLKKSRSFEKLWHDDSWVEKNVTANSFDYDLLESLQLFKDTHPNVMKDRLMKKSWQFNYDATKKKLSLKERFSNWIEKLTGWRIGEYKNYILLD